MTDRDLTETIQQLMTEVARLRQELNRLKAGQREAPASTELKPSSGLPSSRRQILRRLAAGLLVGVGAVTGAGAIQPAEVQAKFITATRATTSIVPPNGSISHNLPPNTEYGLIVTPDTNVDFAPFADNIKGGVLGYTTQSGGIGVSGQGPEAGVCGFSLSGPGLKGFGTTGVFATGSATNGMSFGVQGFGNTGVFGSGDLFGVHGKSTNFAGFFEGNVQVTGTLTKPAGSFKIDHPLDPDNKYLYHSFVESPDMMNIYNGIVKLDKQGEASVEMPEWFEALNSDYRYQLTPIGEPGPNLHISQKINGLRFKIAGGVPGQEVSWQVTGIRQDAFARAHRIPVEETKSEQEKGKYLNPELFGKSEEGRVTGFNHLLTRRD